MKTISIYVHDLFLEIGHSNVTIDMVNNLPNQENIQVKFIAFTHDKKERLFPETNLDISFHKVPFQNLKPVLLKVLFYQFYTFMYALFCDRAQHKISLGISNLYCEYSIVHFLHKQWSDIYFKVFKFNFIKLLYKTIFYKYLNLCENFFYTKKNIRIISVSDFMNHYIQQNYKVPQANIKTIHTAFNPKRFTPKEITQISQKYLNLYPQLIKLEQDKPIHLFIGAFERKGLQRLIDRQFQDQQFIIIGSPEGHNQFDFSSFEKVIHIPHTKEIQFFYNISDHLVFPTIYEPFGMVLIEAALMGLNVTTMKHRVGASEVLVGHNHIDIKKQDDDFGFNIMEKKLSFKQKVQRHKNLCQNLEQYNWQNQSQQYYDFIFSRID